MKETVRITKHARLQLKETSITIQKGEYLVAYRIGTTLVLKKCSPHDMGYKVKVGKNLEITVPKTYFNQIQIIIPAKMIIMYYSNCITISPEAATIYQEKDLPFAEPLAIETRLNTNMVVSIPCHFWMEEVPNISFDAYKVTKEGLLVRKIKNSCKHCYLRRNQIYISMKIAEELRLVRSDILYLIQKDIDTFLLSKTSQLQKEAQEEKKSKSKYLKQTRSNYCLEPEKNAIDGILKRDLLLQDFAKTHYLFTK